MSYFKAYTGGRDNEGGGGSHYYRNSSTAKPVKKTPLLPTPIHAITERSSEYLRRREDSPYLSTHKRGRSRSPDVSHTYSEERRRLDSAQISRRSFSPQRRVAGSANRIPHSPHGRIAVSANRRSISPHGRIIGSTSRRSASPHGRIAGSARRRSPSPFARHAGSSNRRSRSPFARPAGSSDRRSRSPHRNFASGSTTRRSGSPHAHGSRNHEKQSSKIANPSEFSIRFRPSNHSAADLKLIDKHSAKKDGVVRHILDPDKVIIPRRAGEGAKLIFDRVELREGIERRMKGKDNEKNEPIEQRVVAIIREPVLIDSFSSSSRKHALALVSEARRPKTPERHKITSGHSGMSSYHASTHSPNLEPTHSRGRSISAERQSRGRERFEFEQQKDPTSGTTGHSRDTANSFHRPKSPISRSKKVDSDRVSRMNLPAASDNRPQRSSFQSLGAVRGKDLRETLHRPVNEMIAEPPVRRHVVDPGSAFYDHGSERNVTRRGRGGPHSSSLSRPRGRRPPL